MNGCCILLVFLSKASSLSYLILPFSNWDSMNMTNRRGCNAAPVKRAPNVAVPRKQLVRFGSDSTQLLDDGASVTYFFEIAIWRRIAAIF